MAIGQAITDIGAYFGDQAKSAFDAAEGREYQLAEQYALANEQYTKFSTAIKDAQADREAALKIGGIHSEVAGAGFAESGSALDVLRSSASQAALQHSAISEQGLITEAGYAEQAQSYSEMANAAIGAAKAEKTAGAFSLAAGIVEGISSFMSGGGGGGGGGDGTIDIPTGVGGDFVGA